MFVSCVFGSSLPNFSHNVLIFLITVLLLMGFFSIAALANGEALLYFCTHTHRNHPFWSVSTRVRTPLKYRLTAARAHSVHSTNFLLRSVHCCHLSDNFMIDAANQSLETVYSDSWKRLYESMTQTVCYVTLSLFVCPSIWTGHSDSLLKTTALETPNISACCLRISSDAMGLPSRQTAR